MQAQLLPENASSLEEFTDQCRDVVTASRHVIIDQRALQHFARQLGRPGTLHDYRDRVAAGANRPAPVLLDIAFAAANLAGFTSVENGVLAPWGKHSGSHICGDAGWLEKQAALRAAGSPAPEQARTILNGIPHADERLGIIAEFAAPKALRAAEKITANCLVDNDVQIVFDDLRDLTATFPQSFGQDPFLKKASAAMIGLASYYAGPEKLDVETPLPADCRTALSLHKAGVLRLSDHFVAAIEGKTIFEADDPRVTELRAATVVAGAGILERRPDFDMPRLAEAIHRLGCDQPRLEAAAYTPAYRAYPGFAARTQKPYAVATLHH